MLELSDALGQRDLTYHLLCECGQAGCAERVEVESAVYETARAAGDRFIVTPDHEQRGSEHVVAQGSTYRIVAAVRAVRPELVPRTA